MTPELNSAFKAAMRRLAATVTVLSTTAENGSRHGMTATAVTSVSADPPAVLACVNRSAALHAQLGLGRRLCINLLHCSQQRLSEVFAGGMEGDIRFNEGDWLNNAEGVPYLADAQANIFCEIEALHAYGTHSVCIGRVTSAVCRADVAPLVYQDGTYMCTGPLVE
ncbi:flavin reductase family protein [Ferrovibrio terrae]|uniref:Flavin reductase family protein n=1 Tax=Ferrovibrio terrae TaxID=2594003 RepID=A0A516H739_9PROT|nr:flavin reductase family protein [Ferrovibrio terrae]QDO99583.1 flavin reductase family protein [Ferrovibrio terrae]